MKRRISRILSRWVLLTTALSTLLPALSNAQNLKVIESERDRVPRTDVYGDPLPPGALARIGTLRDFIGEGSSRIIFSPDGRFVTATSEFLAPPLRLWDPETGRVLRELNELDPKGARVRHIAFSYDSKLIAAADSVGNVRLGSTRTGRKIREFPGHDDIWEVAFSVDGKILRVWHGRTVWFWDIAAGSRTHWHSLAGNQPGTFRHFLEFVSLRRSPNVLRHAPGLYQSILLSPYSYILGDTLPDSKLPAFKGYSASQLWDVGIGRRLRSIPRLRQPQGLVIENMEYHLEFSPDGKRVAAAVTLNSLGLWDMASGDLYRRFPNVDISMGFTFAPDGKRLVTGGDHFRYWDIARGTAIRRYPQQATVTGMAFTPDGKALVTAAGDTLYLWDISTGRQIPRFEGRHRFRGFLYPWEEPNIMALALAPDGKTLISGGEDGSFWLWDLSTGKKVREVPEFDRGASSVAFAPDGKTFATADEHGARLWGVHSGREVHRFPATSKDSIISLDFSPDGATLAAGTMHGISLWDVKTRKVQRTIAHPQGLWCVAFAHDGKTLASGDYEGVIRLWELERGAFIREFGRKFKPGEEPPGVTVIAFLPDGRTVASAGEDPFVTLWDQASGRELRRLSGHQASVCSITISPDGKTLASGSKDGTVLLWDLRKDERTSPPPPH